MPKSRNRPHHKKRLDKRIADQARISRLRSAAAHAVKTGQQAWMILVAVLAQHGGSVTVTQGTIDQVGLNIARLGYTIEPSDVAGEFRVRMTETPEEPANGTGTVTQESSDPHNQRTGDESGIVEGSIRCNDDDARGITAVAGEPDRHPRDFTIRRLGPDVAAEGGD